MQEISDAQIVISEGSVGGVYFNIQGTVHESLWKPLISQSKQPGSLTFIPGAGAALSGCRALVPDGWMEVRAGNGR